MTTKDKLWNKDYIKAMGINFTIAFAFYLFAPILPIYLHERFGTLNDTIGLVLSGYTIAALIFRPFSGYIVDSFSRKKILIFFLVLSLVFYSMYLLAFSLTLFAIIRTVHGAPYGGSTVATSTVAIDVLPSSRRNEGIGYYGLSNNIATAIAPTAGILIYKWTGNFDLLFVLAILFAAISVCLSYSIKIPQKNIIKNKQKISLDRFLLIKGWFLGANMIFFSFCYGILSNYVAIYAKEKLGVTSGSGIFFLLLSIGLILSRLKGNKSLKEGKLIRHAFIGISVSTIGYTLFAGVQNNVAFYLSALLVGLGNGHMYPAFSTMIINVAQHNERGTANSTLLTAWDLGLGIGILVGGLVSQFMSYLAAFWIVALVHLIGLIFFIIITRKLFIKKRLR